MRRLAIGLVVVSLVSMVELAWAQEWRPVAALELSQGSVAACIGFSWGSGTLTYLGRTYPVKVLGLSVGEVGITWASAKGTVFDLKKLEDFSGKYAAGGAGGTVGQDVQIPAADRGLRYPDDRVAGRPEVRICTVFERFLAGPLVDEGRRSHHQSPCVPSRYGSGATRSDAAIEALTRDRVI